MMGYRDAGRGFVLLIGEGVLFAVIVMALAGLLYRSRPLAWASVFLVMLPIWGCGFGLWALPGEICSWFPLVWLLQAAILATLLLTAQFRTLAIPAFLLSLLLAVWLVLWPAQDYLQSAARFWALGIPLAAASVLRAYSPRS